MKFFFSYINRPEAAADHVPHTPGLTGGTCKATHPRNGQTGRV